MRLTDTEWQIMNALWRSHPATAREIQEHLDTEVSWAYTTLKTMLTRLVGKGAVSETKRRNTSVYEPLITRSAARRSALAMLIDNAFGGAVEPFLGFLADDVRLGKQERRALRELLEDESPDNGDAQ